MSADKSALASSVAHAASGLLEIPLGGIASRVIARTPAGNVTLFAMDADQEISEHTTPFDALVLVLEGRLGLTIGGARIDAAPHDIVRMPAHVPHALRAAAPCRFVLVMLREPQPAL